MRSMAVVLLQLSIPQKVKPMNHEESGEHLLVDLRSIAPSNRHNPLMDLKLLNITLPDLVVSQNLLYFFTPLFPQSSRNAGRERR